MCSYRAALQRNCRLLLRTNAEGGLTLSLAEFIGRHAGCRVFQDWMFLTSDNPHYRKEMLNEACYYFWNERAVARRAL